MWHLRILFQFSLHRMRHLAKPHVFSHEVSTFIYIIKGRSENCELKCKVLSVCVRNEKFSYIEPKDTMNIYF